MQFITTLAAAFVGGAVFERLHVPAGALIGAMVAVTALNLSPVVTAEPPVPIRFLGYVVIGWLIGQGITREVLRSLLRDVGLILSMVVLLLLLGGTLAFVLYRIGVLDAATAFLAVSPGGLSQMTALSAAVGADSAIVATVHVVRVVVVIVAAPFVVKLLPAAG